MSPVRAASAWQRQRSAPWAGTADGAAATASFNRLGPIARDGLGNQHVDDTGSVNLRKISAAGVVSTVAGSGQPGYANGLR